MFFSKYFLFVFVHMWAATHWAESDFAIDDSGRDTVDDFGIKHQMAF